MIKISSRLGEDLEKIRKCFTVLEELGFVKKNKAGKYVLIKGNYSWVSSETTTEAKKKYQLKMLEKSTKSLDKDSWNQRDHTSVTLAIKKSEMPRFKEIINDTRRKLTKMLNETKSHDEVYCLQISFFPLTH